jgi:hypothetical protein
LLGNVLLEMIFYKFLLAFVQGCDSGSLLWSFYQAIIHENPFFLTSWLYLFFS